MIKKISFLGLIWGLFFYCNTAFSEIINKSTQKKELSLVLHEANEKKLSNEIVWLRLLHFRVTPNVAKHSDITSPKFFLSLDNNTKSYTSKKRTALNISPEQELIATLKGFYEPTVKDQNTHPQCRFPARFLWLDKKLDLTKRGLPKIDCSRLNEWAKFESLDSVSLIMVSGYFGNPASTFGHLLVKLNNSEFKQSSGNLLDQSINYGAKVPDNEPIPIYIMKGLLGGYVSNFSNKEFYSQDLVYSKQEYRDMWEYELNLNPYQNRLLVYHIWEMLGMQADYYFLKENCGYRIAELLELVTGEKLTSDRAAWYLPLTVFQELEEVKKSKYIKKITFLPSSQRKLYHGFDQLNNKEQKAVNQLLSQDVLGDTTLIEKFTLARQARMVEVMIEYYQYKLSDADNSDAQNKKYQKFKQYWVLKRLKFPAGQGKNKIAEIPNIVSPAKGAKPWLFQVGLAHNKDRGALLEFGVTAIHYDLLSNSQGLLENIELKFLDVVLNADEKKKISLREFNFISVFKLGLNNTKLHGESNRSWRIKTGAKRNNLSCEDCTNFYLRGGLGFAHKLRSKSHDLITYAMLDSEYHADNSGIEIIPTVGLIFSQSRRFKSSLEAGLNIDTATGDRDVELKLESRYSFSRNNSLRISYEKDKGEQIKASFFHNW